MNMGISERAITYQRIQPFAAVLATFRLMRDPQDTRQVFRLSEALRGRSTKIMFERFAATPVGAKILAEQRSLLSALTDHAHLASLPEGSLGRHYLAFMAEENLSAQGLVDLAMENTKMMKSTNDALKIYAGRMRDMHDLYHVLAGYGRDELGEVCVLAFSYPQQKIRSFWVISRLGMLHIWRTLRAAGFDASGVRAAVREARQNGHNAAWLPGEDIEAMLGMDLQALRAKYNIPSPVVYEEVIARLRRESGTTSGPLKEAAMNKLSRAMAR
jgi:ubiquinone biosynthesis protein COQ4